jgi:TonB dependent receptor/CarboxypepD_reg-like domain/TonB-dependent Receptor Plug Domain
MMFLAKKTLLFLSLFISSVLLAKTPAIYDGGTIKGHVTDKKTGEPLTGAVISVGKYRTTSGLDGSFIIKNIPEGDYEVTITMVTYQTIKQQVKIKNGATTDDIGINLETSTKNLENVVITGHSTTGNTDASARQLERISDNVLNILSSRTIQLAPDVTVANVLRRVSGVTVDRGEDGEGRYPVIRGMDKRYNYTLINGIKIPSPDDKNRYVPMDIFPSEMLQRLEVIKALTPDMEGDAIGGAMNLVMKDAPEKKMIQAQGAFGYSQMLFDNSFSRYDHSVNSKSPLEANGPGYVPTYNDFTKTNMVFTKHKSLPNGQLGFTIGDRFLHNRLGIIFSASLQSTDRVSKETFFLLSPQPNPQLNASYPEYTDAELRNYSIHENRYGLHTKIDYRFNKNNSISLYSIFMQLNNYRSRYYTDSTSNQRTAPGLGNVKYDYYSRTNLQNIYNLTLQGKHGIIPDKFIFDWSAVYSAAGQKTPDKSDLTLYQNFQPDASGSVPTPPVLFSSLTRTWQHNSDKDLAAYINFHYKFKLSSSSFDIGAGAMARHKERDNFYNQYNFKNPNGNVPYTDVYNFTLIPDGGTPQSLNTFSTVEDIAAGYGEIRWQKGTKWNILGGLRVEHTYQSYDQTTLQNDPDFKTGHTGYYDLLPSIHIKYNLTSKAALHLSYYSSISRPGFFEVVPYQFPGEYYTETGNFNLHHTKAYNFDARYELFPGLADQLLIGAFYKTINNPIEYVYDRPATSNSVIKPANIGSAVNVGGEIVYTKYFNKFGVSANYTYTYSRVSVDDKYYYIYKSPATGNDSLTTGSVTVHRPLQGQAAHVGNISLLYKNSGKGTDLQLAAIYTGKHIVYASPYFGKDNPNDPGSGLDYWQRGNVVVDLSGEQRLSRHFSFYFKLTNLLNTKDIIEVLHSSTVLRSFPPYQERSDRILVDKKQYGQSYLLGIRYHL